MPVQQGFNIQEGSPEMGRWSVRMKPETPGLWRSSAVAGPFRGWLWDTICITPARIRDSGLTRATVLSKAVYSGMVTEVEAGATSDPWTLSGSSLLGWLGTSDNPSIGPTGFTSAGSVSLATFLAALFGGGTPAGKYVNGLTLTSASTCDANSITDAAVLGETARELIDRWCRQTTNPTEWWIHPDGGCEFAVQGNSAIFTQTPDVILGRDIKRGFNGSYQCYSATSTVQLSSRDFANVAICFDGTTASESNSLGGSQGTFDPSMQMAASGTAGADTLDGGSLSAYYRADGGAYEAAFLLEMRHKQISGVGEELRTRRVAVDADCLASHLKPGDYCYLHDADTYAVYPYASNEVFVDGRLIYPIKVRVASMQWPIKPGMGVYRISNASGDALDDAGVGSDYDAVVDLSDYVIPEDGTTSVDLNVQPASLRRQMHYFQRREANTASWR